MKCKFQNKIGYCKNGRLRKRNDPNFRCRESMMTKCPYFKEREK